MKNKFILAALMCSAAVISNAVGMNKDPSKYAQNKWRIMMDSMMIVGKYSENTVLNKNNIKIEHQKLVITDNIAIQINDYG